MTKFVKHLTDRAAEIATEGNGLPLPDFVDHARQILAGLAGYRRRGPFEQQDVNYLARQLQATYEMLQGNSHDNDTRRFLPEDADAS